MRNLRLLAFRFSILNTKTFRVQICDSRVLVRQYSSSSIYSNNMPKGKGDKPQFFIKTPKGTKDWEGKDVVIRDKLFTTITDVFKRHGAVNLDTPVFELREILAGKYGEDSKLIYDLADQGGEICSLRYDLTVPFARYLAMNAQIQNIKRYHLAKVYRRDQPAVAKGRMREFYQCDFDIAGSYDPMLSDAEVIRVAKEVFEELGWVGNYTIKVNHRKILDGIFQVCGVPEDKIRSISSAVDKLDKAPWSEVYREMTEEKGLEKPVADQIGEYVQHKGGLALLTNLMSDEKICKNTLAMQGLEEMKLLFCYLETFDSMNCVSLDMSLARGLDYYTGVIFEVVTEGSAPPSVDGKPTLGSSKKDKQGKSANKAEADEDRSADPTLGVGSIAAGGRYDDLVGMFSGKGQIPCVGISFGVDRIFSITKSRMEKEKGNATMRSNEVDVFIMAFGGKGFNGLLKERMEMASTLWNAGIKAEYLYKVKPKLPAQFKAAESNNVPFAVILGEDELSRGLVKIKQLGLSEGHPEKEGVMVQQNDLITEIQSRLRSFNSKDSEDQTIANVSARLQKVKIQDRGDIPEEAPPIPTLT